MNPGIYYLYEYQNKTRKRNVGFLKITRHYQSCILQIHARGISVGNGGSLELWAFCLHGNDMTGRQIASLSCFNRTVSARLPVSESTFPEEQSLFGIDGFLIRLPGGNPPVFWIASGQLFDADPAVLREPAASSPDESLESSSPSEEGTVTGDLPGTAERVPDKALPETKEDSSDSPAGAPSGTPETPSPEGAPEIREDFPETAACPSGTSEGLPETATGSSETSDDLPETAEDSRAEDTSDTQRRSESEQDLSSVRKIQRSDLTRLPRKFWSLANNSFLLHGYHNYGHLLLVEEKGHMWLGIPGIYDPREARAAELFGFPQFTRSYAKELDLDEEERNDSADFGHWCRYLDAAKQPPG